MIYMFYVLYTCYYEGRTVFDKLDKILLEVGTSFGT